MLWRGGAVDARRIRLEPDFDRVSTMESLSARLIEAEHAYTSSEGDERQLARERMVVLLGELSLATRRWSVVRMATDPRPDPTIDEKLRRLTRAELSSVELINEANRILAEIDAAGRGS
jgi:hypothetical protein